MGLRVDLCSSRHLHELSTQTVEENLFTSLSSRFYDSNVSSRLVGTMRMRLCSRDGRWFVRSLLCACHTYLRVTLTFVSHSPGKEISCVVSAKLECTFS